MNLNLAQRCMRSTLSSLTMRTQILLINGFIFTAVVGILLLVQILNMKYSSQIFATSSQNILVTDLSHSLENSASSLEDQIDFFFERTAKMLKKLNLLNGIIYKSDFSIQTLPQMCPYNATTYSEEHFFPLSCIIYHQINDTVRMPKSVQDYQLRNLSQLFTAVIFEIDFGGDYIPTDLFFTSISNPYGFAFYYPPWQKYKDYIPKERPWYKEHMEELLKDPDNNTQLSKVYKFYNNSDVYSMTMTQSIFNETQQVDGIFAADIYLQNKLFKNGNLNMMIVNYDGKLLLTNYKNNNIANSTMYESFINEQVTGFNQTDWDCILNYIHSSITDSNCLSISSEILCRTQQQLRNKSSNQIIIQYYLIKWKIKLK